MFECIAESPLLRPILEAAGTDISNWFDEETKDIKKHVDPQTNILVPYLPRGRVVHVPPSYPTTDWITNFGTPWWKDKRYVIGQLTKMVRSVKITNTLTRNDTILEVRIKSSHPSV